MKAVKYILVIIICLSVGFGVGIWFQKERVIAHGNSCTSNLRMIDSVKEQIAHNLKLVKGDTVSEKTIAEYCKGGVLPTCPAGGVYRINAVGYCPTCSLTPRDSHFHRLMLE